jgi:hypothetical protein
MTSPLPPLAIAQIVARNATALAGILLFGWSAGNVLLLYFWDTLLAMGVIFAGLGSVFIRNEPGTAGTINGQVGAVAMAAFLAVFFAVPLGVPLIFVLAPAGFDWRQAIGDTSFRLGLLTQAIAAFWSYFDLYQALRTHSPEQLRLKRRFALVFLRWLAVLMAIYTGIGILLGPLLFVLVYAGISIWAEIAPDRFLRAMPGGAEDADPDPAAAGGIPRMKLADRVPPGATTQAPSASVHRGKRQK